MDPLAATAGLIAVGAITSGPNNLIALRETAERGWKGALPALTGILVGGLALLVAVVAGASTAFDREPGLAAVMGAGACLLLAALGLGAILRSFAPEDSSGEPKRGAMVVSFSGLLVFQFLNPKAWILVVAAVASIGGRAGSAVTFAQLAALFFLIPALSLALWSWTGVLAMRQLEQRAVQIWFDRLTGGLLIGFAVLLLNSALEAI